MTFCQLKGFNRTSCLNWSVPFYMDLQPKIGVVWLNGSIFLMEILDFCGDSGHSKPRSVFFFLHHFNWWWLGVWMVQILQHVKTWNKLTHKPSHRHSKPMSPEGQTLILSLFLCRFSTTVRLSVFSLVYKVQSEALLHFPLLRVLSSIVGWWPSKGV